MGVLSVFPHTHQSTDREKSCDASFMVVHIYLVI